jgi:class 3 adenylate cyclase
MLDISGYSKLTAELSSRGRISSELVTRTVKLYMDKLIEIIDVHGGDVVKFLGDALLVTFSSSNGQGEPSECIYGVPFEAPWMFYLIIPCFRWI